MTKWVMDIMYSGGYFSIVFLMFVENIFPPIPSEFIMPLAGFMVTQDKFSLVGIIIAGTIGSTAGAIPFYLLGRKLGAERLIDFADRHGKWLTVSGADIERANSWFERHGWMAVFVCRLIPGIRSLISIPAGINRMSLPAFLICTVLGSAVWTSFLAYAGYFLGSNFKEIERYFDPISYIVFGAIIFLYLRRLLGGKGKSQNHAGNQSV